MGCGELSQELMGELKSVLGPRKVLSHSMLLLVRCAEVIWLIRLKLMSGLLGDRDGRLLEMTRRRGPGRCEEVMRGALT